MTPAQLAKQREYQRVWRKNNAEAVKGYKRKRRNRNINAARAEDRKWKQQQDPDVKKNAKLKKQYGISVEDFRRIAELQHHACAICERRKPLDVDHNHITSEVRQLLCRSCNLALGLFQDCPTILDRASLYLKVHNVRV